MKIAVIGAGAGGIMAALHASRSSHQITLFEHNSVIGKKLLVTGSGRANLTNDNLDPTLYYCDDNEWMATFLDRFGVAEMKDMLEKLGISLFRTDDGWYYPESQSAHAVTEILKERLEEAKVSLRVATEVEWINFKEGQFELKINQDGQSEKEHFDYLVLAAGGKAYPELGSKGLLFPALENMGHTILPIFPGLGPIYTDLGVFKALKGQRFDAITSIYKDGERLQSTFGNLIVTEKGFNGPAVMNLSHQIGLHSGAFLELQVNFLGPYWEGLAQDLADLEYAQGSLRALLLRVLNPKAVDFFLEQAKISPKTQMKAVQAEELMELLRVATNNRFKISGAGNFSNSQIKVGGVPVSEVDPESFQSRIIPGLYLIGETNNVGGLCGGYNIHYAFGSGCLAGRALANLN